MALYEEGLGGADMGQCLFTLDYVNIKINNTQF